MTRRARRALARLPLHDERPLTAEALLEAAGAHLGQRLRLTEELPEGVAIDINRVCGLTWPGAEGERLIWVSPRSVGEHRLFNAAHEVAHLLLGHAPVTMASLGRDEPGGPDSDGFRFLSQEFRNGLLVHAREPGAARGSARAKAEDEADYFGKRLLLVRDRAQREALADGDPLVDQFRRSL